MSGYTYMVQEISSGYKAVDVVFLHMCKGLPFSTLIDACTDSIMSIPDFKEYRSVSGNICLHTIRVCSQMCP